MHILLSQPVLLLMVLMFSAQSWGLEIASVYHEPKTFEPQKQQKVEIHFTLSTKAQVTVNIFDDRDYLVKKIPTSRAQGAQIVHWDGKDMAGHIVPAEAYRYTIEAKGASGEKAEYDTSDITGGITLKAKNIAWDKNKKVVSYQLPEPARAIIRIGIQNRGPLMKSLLEWSPRSAGFQEEAWDGMDASGVINLSTHPKLEISVDAYNLSDNSIIVGSTTSRTQYITNMSWGKTKRKVKHKRKKKMFAHVQQSAETRNDLDVKLVLAGEYKKNKTDLAIVSGIVPIRLEVSGKDQGRLLERGFEPIFFIDGIYMQENEMGFLPVTWQWDTRKVTEGEHFITGNIRSYEGNFGTATLKVYVKQ